MRRMPSVKYKAWFPRKGNFSQGGEFSDLYTDSIVGSVEADANDFAETSLRLDPVVVVVVVLDPVVVEGLS